MLNPLLACRSLVLTGRLGAAVTVTSKRDTATAVARSLAPLLLLIVMAHGHDASADAPIPAEYVSVGDFTGTVQQRIDAAIFAARFSEHKTVYFPNGTYALRSGLNLDLGADTELHLIGESRDGVFLVPDTAYLEANYNGGDWENGGARLAHMINLSRGSVFDSVDVSIQNMTIDMQSQRVNGQPETYNVVGHGVRVGQGWVEGQFTVNEVTIRNVGSYGIGIQDRGGHPKNNVTLSNLHIERTGSDGIDTKEAGGDGNRNLVIQNVSVNEVGYLDTGAAPAIDIRYRDTVIENVNLVSAASHSTLPGQTSSTTGIVFRPFEAGAAGIVGATVSDVYIRGFGTGISVGANENTQHQNIDISDFRIQGQKNAGIGISGTNHSGHTISDGFVDPAFGGAAVNAGGLATVTNVTAGRWDPALTPTTDTTFEANVSFDGDVFSPAWEGMVGVERVSLNPVASSPGPFVFDVGDTGILQIDFDGLYNAADRLIVDGTLNLDGELRVNLIDAPPTAAGTFQIFEADQITGVFDQVTLPAAGAGLFWDSDSLSVDGTLTLLQGQGLLFGDTGNTNYDALNPDDTPPVDPAFRADLQAVSANWTFKGLDEDGRNDVRAMTFDFDPLDADELENVWIEARVQGLSGYENDNMALDAVGNNRKIDQMQGYVEGGGWMTLRYDLDPDEFALLADGQLNLAFFDDTRVDWVSLTWIESMAAALINGDYNGDGFVSQADLDLVLLNWGAADLPDGFEVSALGSGGSFDGLISQNELDGVLLNWGSGTPPSVTNIPEPTSAALMSLGGLMFLRIGGLR